VTVTADVRPSPSLTTQAVWLMVAKTMSFGLAIALPLLLVRRLTQEDLGLYKQAFFVVTTAMNVLPLGFGMSAFYFLPRERARQGAVIANILAFILTTGLAAALVLLVWPGLVARLFSSAELAGLSRPLSAVVLLWTIGAFLELITVAIQDVRSTTAFIVLMQTSKTALLIGAAPVFGTVQSLVYAALIQGAVQVGVLVLYLWRRFPGFWKAFDWPLLRRQGAYALPLGFSGLVLSLQETLPHLFVSHAFGPVGYAIYSVGVFNLPLIGILRESAGAVMLPRINQLESENDARQILVLVASAARKLALVYLPLFAFLMVSGRDLVIFLFTQQYAESWPIFAVSRLMIPLSVIVLDPITRAHEDRFFFMRLRMAVLAVITIVLWTSARTIGLVGIIGLVVGAGMFTWSVAVIRMARMLDFGVKDLPLFRPVALIAASSAVAALTCGLARATQAEHPAWMALAVAASVFGITYAAGLGLTGVMAKAELAHLFRDVSRLWITRRPAAIGAAPPPPTEPGPAAAATPRV
jgi:O-antigen/teichoic acid export membrane protein